MRAVWVCTCCGRCRVIAERAYERDRSTPREQFYRVMSGTDQISEVRTVAEVERLLRRRGIDPADLVEQ